MPVASLTIINFFLTETLRATEIALVCTLCMCRLQKDLVTFLQADNPEGKSQYHPSKDDRHVVAENSILIIP